MRDLLIFYTLAKQMEYLPKNIIHSINYLTKFTNIGNLPDLSIKYLLFKLSLKYNYLDLDFIIYFSHFLAKKYKTVIISWPIITIWSSFLDLKYNRNKEKYLNRLLRELKNEERNIFTNS